jgi:protease IV
MKNFLIYTLATITGIVISSFLLFLIMIASLSALVASGEKPVSLSDKTILTLNAGVPIPDRGNPNPWSGFDFTNMTFSPTPGLNEILENIKKAAGDEKIQGILIENGLNLSGWATTGEIRDALKKFRESGKFVIAWSDYLLSQEGYYLSTSADRIYMNPGTVMDFKGLSGEVMFYKKALDKLGIEVQVIRHGKFKGATEPYMLNKLSDENREQIKDYVGSIWDNAIKAISESRDIPVSKLNEIAGSLAAFGADGALENKLVDGLIYRDQLIDTIKTLSGVKLDDKIQFVSMSKYSKIPDRNKTYSAKNRIAVIYAEGTITLGKGTDQNIGGNSYADIIRTQRKDSTIKAIVLRVNSPGGAASAADLMWRELELAAEVKPVVVSMGNYAASGGYYIAAPATKIYASPSTITGSIGVFGLIPNAGKLLDEKLGLTTETVNTNRYSDFPSIFRPMDTYEKAIFQKSIEKTYADFVGKVASGRKMKAESVDSIGQGRVWTGSRAIGLGLVDEFGGLEAAVKGAAELAGVTEYSLKEYPVIEDPYTKLITSLTGEIKLKILSREIGINMKYFNQLKELSTLSGIQARLPYFIDIR